MQECACQSWVHSRVLTVGSGRVDVVAFSDGHLRNASEKPKKFINAGYFSDGTSQMPVCDLRSVFFFINVQPFS